MANKIREHLKNVKRTLEEKKERNKAQRDQHHEGGGNHCNKKTNRIM